MQFLEFRQTPLGFPVGISIAFWSTIGLARLIQENFFPLKTNAQPPNLSEFAVVVPAHNEEVVIKSTISWLKKSLNPDQIYISADGCTDKTVIIAKDQNVQVTVVNPSQGKAKALKHAIKHFDLYKKYKYILIVDADTQIDPSYFEGALQHFRNKNVSVVFGAPKLHWHKINKYSIGAYFIFYRDRLNFILRYALAFGQTWTFTNVNYVIPGFSATYRADVLQKLELDTPGLLIEDFNLAFQLHKKKLGKIGFQPSMIAWDQHPDNLKDYWKQVRRWNIGFFQTVKRWKVWPSLFWVSLAVFSFEVFGMSLFMLASPAILFFYLFSYLPLEPLVSFYQIVDSPTFFTHLGFVDFLVFVFLIDYFVTVVYSLIIKKPQVLFYGLFFYFLHVTTSLILVSSLVPGFFSKSQGRWVSPRRQRV